MYPPFIGLSRQLQQKKILSSIFVGYYECKTSRFCRHLKGASPSPPTCQRSSWKKISECSWWYDILSTPCFISSHSSRHFFDNHIIEWCFWFLLRIPKKCRNVSLTIVPSYNAVKGLSCQSHVIKRKLLWLNVHANACLHRCQKYLVLWTICACAETEGEWFSSREESGTTVSFIVYNHSL